MRLAVVMSMSPAHLSYCKAHLSRDKVSLPSTWQAGLSRNSSIGHRNAAITSHSNQA